MGKNLRNLTAAVSLTFLSSCSSPPPTATTPPPQTPNSSNNIDDGGLLGFKNPETGCFEKKAIDENGVEKITDITCPFTKDL